MSWIEDMSPGAGNFLGGSIGALGSLAGAYMSYQQAQKDRKLKKNMFNKENQLNIQQLNMDLNRLAGLDAAISGRTAAEMSNVIPNSLAGSTMNLDQYQALQQQLANGGVSLANQMDAARNKARDYVQNNNASLARINPADYKI